jgi:hypothetical protein
MKASATAGQCKVLLEAQASAAKQWRKTLRLGSVRFAAQAMCDKEASLLT